MRVVGHPIHPALVHVPIAAWVLTPLADAVWLAGGDSFFARAALWLTGVGIAGALAAAAAGAVDLLAAKLDDAPATTAGAHASVMASATTLAGVGLLGRLFPDALPGLDPRWPIVLGVPVAFLTLAGAWLGGELVYRHGVGRRES